VRTIPTQVSDYRNLHEAIEVQIDYGKARYPLHEKKGTTIPVFPFPKKI